MLEITGHFEEALNLLNGISDRAKDSNYILNQIVKTELRKNIRDNFKGQHDPDGNPWEKSKLSQTDKTGSPRNTLMRSLHGFETALADESYIQKGQSLEVFNLATPQTGKSNYYYMQGHNFGKWRFAGLSQQGLENIQNETINFILNGK